MHLLDRFYSREDFHQSVGYAKIMEDIGWSSIPVSGSRIAVRQLGPFSIAKMQRPSVIDLPALMTLRKRLLIFHLIIEPPLTGTLIDKKGKPHTFSFLKEKKAKEAQNIFQECFFKKTFEHYAHSKTALIDLAPPLDKVLSHFPSKTRYNIRLSQKRGAVYRAIPFATYTQEQQKEFFLMHKRWSKEKHVMGYTNRFLKIVFSCFAHNGWMIEARMDGVLSGGMMILIHDRIAYYFYTCSTINGREKHIPTGMLAAALKLSQEQGADIFDFCSVYDERYPGEHPRWKGFTTFKERFSPEPIYYPPSFHRWL